MEVFEEAVKKATKAGKQFVKDCPAHIEEVAFMQHLLKKKTSADAGVLLQKDIVKNLEQFQFEAKSYPEHMHDVLLTPATCQEAEKTALRIAGNHTTQTQQHPLELQPHINSMNHCGACGQGQERIKGR